MPTLTPEQRQIVEAVKAELLAGTSDLSKAPIASASQAQALAAISADNQLMRLTIDALLNNLALNSGLIQFAGIKAPAKALNSASVVAVASQSYSFSVFLNPSTNKFYIERRNKDGVGPGAVVSCHSRWSGGQSDSVSSDVYDMEYYGTPASTVTPYAGRIYSDAAGHIYVYAANKLTSAIPHDSEIGAGILIRIDSADNKLKAGTAAKTYLTIGPHAVTDISRTGDGDGVIIVDQGKLTFGANVTLGQGSSMKNATVDVDKTTGVLKITNADQTKFGDLQHLTVGSYNTIGSGNLIQSNVNLSDRAALNAHVVSYAANGLLSIRHVIDGSAYSGMEHLNMGGYNVMGSNNKLASNINIGDNASIGARAAIGANVKINIADSNVCIAENQGLDGDYYANLGYHVNIGRWTEIGEGVMVGACTFIGVPEAPGYATFIGERVWIGENVNLPIGFNGDTILRELERIKAALGLT